MKPDWDSYFMKIAYAVSDRSTCDRTFIGSVLVLDKRILTNSFIGSPTRQPHCDEVRLQKRDNLVFTYLQEM